MIEKNGAEIVIVGDGELAEIAYEYFTYDSQYTVVAFAVEAEYKKQDEKCGLPVIEYEQVESRYPPNKYSAFVAVTYTQLNRVRTRLFQGMKSMGYKMVSYVSSHAFVWRNVEIGENCFIFENNVLQHMVKVGDNVILWSGNHIGHRSVIEENVYISSHVVVSGYCVIGKGSFLGVNCTLNDNIKIAEDNILGSGSVITKKTEPGKIYVGNPAKELPKRTSYRALGVKEEEI